MDAPIMPNTELAQSNQHYDLDPALFAAFLDPTLKYSSGLYLAGDEDLQTAQFQKLEFISDALEVKRDRLYLDVGCGWGSLVLHIALHRGARVLGVTPSTRQAEFIKARANDLGVASRVDVRVSTVEEIALDRSSIDGASFVGSIVHMADRVGVLKKVAGALRARSKLYISESCYRNLACYERFRDAPGTSFVRDEVFGNGEMVPASFLLAALEESGFSMESAVDITEDYRKTIAAWIANIDRARDVMEEICPGAPERFRRYLIVGDTGFATAVRQVAFVAKKGR